MVKAKFYVGNVAVSSLDEDGKPAVGVAHMYPVCRGAANKRWAAYSPAGHFEITTKGPALGWFFERIGKELSISIDDASSDPVTHEFVALEEEFQHENYREVTCAECGHPEASHQ